MLGNLNEWVYYAVQGSPWVALSAAFVWGILSVILSPCHLSSIPLLVGFISGQAGLNRARALGISSLFALGILVTIALIGVITAAMGKMILGDIGPLGNYLVAGLLLVIGLHLMGVIPLPFSGPGSVQTTRRGPLAAFILGLVFGVALGPCTFGFMAPVLTASIASAKTSLTFSIALLTLYGVGHCAVIALAGASTETVQRYLNWNEKSHGTVILKRICGVLVILGGAFLIYTAS